jgi:hypothetical protein
MVCVKKKKTSVGRDLEMLKRIRVGTSTGDCADPKDDVDDESAIVSLVAKVTGFVRLPSAILCVCLGYLPVTDLTRVLQTCRLLNRVGRLSGVSNGGHVRLYDGFPQCQGAPVEIPPFIKTMRLARLTLCDIRVQIEHFVAPDVAWRDTLRDLTLAPYDCTELAIVDATRSVQTSTPGYACLNALTALHTLRVYNSCMTRLLRLTSALKLPNLTYLDLRGANCSSFTLLSKLPQLVVLDLADMNDDVKLNERVATLPSFTALRALRIQACTKASPASLPSLPSLTELRLSFIGNEAYRGQRSPTRPQPDLAPMLARSCPELCNLCVAGFDWVTIADLRSTIRTLVRLSHISLPRCPETQEVDMNRTFAVPELRRCLETFSGEKHTIVTDIVLNHWKRHQLSSTTAPTLFIE